MSALLPFDGVHASLEGTTLIEASAGTGKTHTISTLFVRLLLERGHLVSEILVVTYTRAATAELKQRIRARLAEALDVFDRAQAGSLDAEQRKKLSPELVAFADKSRERDTLKGDRRRLVAALRSFDQAAIFTIHAFCQRMLTERAFETAIAFDLEMVDDQSAWLAEVVHDFWAKNTYDADECFVAHLWHEGVTARSLLKLANVAAADSSLVIVPDVGWLDTHAARAVFEQARATVHELFETHRDALQGLLTDTEALNQRSHHRDKIVEVFLPAFERAREFRACALPSAVDKLSTETLKKATKKNAGVRPHVFFDACSELQRAAATLEALNANNRLAFEHDLVRFVRRELPQKKADAGVQGFDDLLLRLGHAIDGARGDELAQQIRESYPAALIDEFQDTDPLQCRIFQRIYDVEAKAPGVLFLIGDPKQAIYGFRGADVFAYMAAAKHTSTRAFTLGTNRRSDPSLVDAVNQVFARARTPFLFEDIAFSKVEPGPTARERLQNMPVGSAALEIFFIPRGEETRLAKGKRDEEIPAAVAEDIVTLLGSGAHIAVDPPKPAEPIEPRHLAVLCRTNHEARTMQRALRKRGVPAVVEGDASVFSSETAESLDRVLAALAEPANAGFVRAAITTPLVGKDARDLQQLQDDEQLWDGWVTRFHAWHELWETRGFIQAFHALLADQEVIARMLQLPYGERSLTDLMHMAELLQAEATARMHGPLSLLAWFRQMCSDDASSRAELPSASVQMRMESDARAVTLTTIHKSKGLEYPIVYAPFLWDGTLLRSGDTTVRFHDEANDLRLTLDLRDPKVSTHTARAKREVLAENLRVLYVALTRAKHRLCLVWGAFKDSETSALGYLLHQAQDASLHDLADATGARIQLLSDSDMLADLDALVRSSAGHVAVRTLPTPRSSEYRVSTTVPKLLARTAPYVPTHLARSSSFSRLISIETEKVTSFDDAIENDALHAVPSVELEEPVQPQRVVLADFPSGPNPGQLIHSVYENIDFRSTDVAALRAEAQRALFGHGVDTSHGDALCVAIAQSLATPLGVESELPSLSVVAPESRLVELEFMFPVAHASSRELAFSARLLGEVLAKHARDAAERAYAASVAALGFAPLTGFLRGFMDLVARHEGRFYLVDYKSNHLGAYASDYRPAQLAIEMARHHYTLQYLIYCVALHRHLGLRVRDYDYERHFGGVYYLFVRGMAPQHELGTGVFHARPTFALVDELSEALENPGGVT